jgi:CRP/FNR family transcriptional regulator
MRRQCFRQPVSAEGENPEKRSASFVAGADEYLASSGWDSRVATIRLTTKSSCSTCHVRSLCLPAGAAPESLQNFDELVWASRRLGQGETLYTEGSRFRFLFAIRSGTFKSVVLSPAGAEQVTGFHFAGDLLGLDGLASGFHASGATALEDSEICVIPHARLTARTEGGFDLQQAVARIMSREIVREHGLVMLLATMSAEARLAAFLLNLSRRLKVRGYSGSEFHLRMSRIEIASYLGVKVETVSRTFTTFEQRCWIRVNRKHVHLVDFAALQGVFERQAW